MTSCTGTCVDLMHSDMHCGACGTACPTGGATNATYDMGSVNAADEGTYCVVVSGTANSVTNCATLTVMVPTTTSELSGLTLCQGAEASFSTTAYGTGPFHYQWTLDCVPVGTDEWTLTLNTASLSAGDHVVGVTVSGQCGSAGSTAVN